MIRSTLPALCLLALLTGCGTATPGAGDSHLPPLPPPPPEWRMLTQDEGAAPTPLGYVEIQRVAGQAGTEGSVYLVYDRDFHVLGHVTRRGQALRYRGPDDDIGESLGRGSLPDQLIRILGAKSPLRSFDLQGRPREIP